MTIAEMRQAILDKGWQFLEHVFNDGSDRDCFIRLTWSRNYFAFDFSARSEEDRNKEVGWGRYPRQYAWEQAYQAIVVEEIRPT